VLWSGIPFYYLPVTPENKAEQEGQVLELLAGHDVDFVVLAQAVRWHIEHRVMVDGTSTVVFQ
jgi:formyltetrahydrofolate hydrolase